MLTRLLLHIVIEDVKQGQEGSTSLPSRLASPIQDDAVHHRSCCQNLQENEGKMNDYKVINDYKVVNYYEVRLMTISLIRYDNPLQAALGCHKQDACTLQCKTHKVAASYQGSHKLTCKTTRRSLQGPHSGLP